MAKDRWNQGRPSLGDSFAEGFVSPWNSNTRKGHGDYNDIATIPSSPKPATMAGEMDGDDQTTFTCGRGKK